MARLLEMSAGSLTDNRKLQSGQPHGLLQKVKVCTLADLPDSLKPIQGFDYEACREGDSANTSIRLPEVVVSCIIKYYAYDSKIKNQRAVMLDNLMSALGVRTFFKTLMEEEPEIVAPEQSTSLAVSQPTENTIDTRVAVVKEMMDILANANPEYREKALLTLLGIL